ncbi:type II toxin-antitoxin system RelE/ParE family toxin [Candidatus Tisiphia endosymbiont of Ditula angustiorana]|uniref:type II toxin-antitoxin system RelE family toxin n=1 Tax=Candidatus Tisiphia endosymbiont of Ditula angustiorana TaxID=3066272 RepID=UPI00312C9935
MTWKVEFDLKAVKEFRKLDKTSQGLISNYFKNKVLRCSHPKDLGKSMQYDYVGLWRYRIGKYRVICSIEEELLTVLVLRVAIRDEVYTQ